MMLCSRCKKRPAVVFITAMQGDKKKNEEMLRIALGELRQLLLDNPRLPYKGGWEE